MTDAALIARIRSGDQEAATVLVRRYYDDCWRFAYRMIGQRADAEDVVQETFLRALRALKQYEERQLFRAWIFCILTNQCRTALARQRSAARFVTDDRIEQIPAESDDESDSKLELPPERLADALQDAIGRLGQQYREAFLLKHAEGMEYTQMAEITGATIPALKMRVKRAREMLRPLMEENLRD